MTRALEGPSTVGYSLFRMMGGLRVQMDQTMGQGFGGMLSEKHKEDFPRAFLRRADSYLG